MNPAAPVSRTVTAAAPPAGPPAVPARAWPSAMWHSWMRAVSLSGTSSGWSHRPMRRLALPAEQAHGHDAHLARRPQRAHHIGRAAGGGDAEQHVAGAPQPAQRPLEHAIVAVVVAAGGQRRRIERQRQRRPGRPLDRSAQADQHLGRQMLAVRRRAAVAAEHQLAAAPQAGLAGVHHRDDRRRPARPRSAASARRSAASSRQSGRLRSW